MHDAWSDPMSWSEVCRRAAGRREYNKRRQIVAAVRRHVIAKHVRQVGLRRGVQAELSRVLQVSKSTICQDMRRLLARSEGRSRPAWHTGQRGQTPARRRGRDRRRKVHMPEKLSLRLSTTLSEALQHEARGRGVSASAMIRLALQQVLGQSTPASVPSALPPSDAWERLLTTCPLDVQAAVRQAVDVSGLPLESVLKALIITACQPKTTP